MDTEKVEVHLMFALRIVVEKIWVFNCFHKLEESLGFGNQS